jgi:hypothetical protein
MKILFRIGFLLDAICCWNSLGFLLLVEDSGVFFLMGFVGTLRVEWRKNERVARKEVFCLNRVEIEVMFEVKNNKML